MNRSFLKNNLDLILILAIYSLLAIFSVHFYLYKTGGDEISYINIAHAYALSKWGDAINGCWSPLYSWLLTPLLLPGFTPIYGVYASKILSLIIGFFAIISTKILLNTFEISKTVKRVTLLSLIPVILYFALMYNTPDLLAASILIIYLSIIFSPNYSNSQINSILCGFTGAMAFLSKSFVFPFFIVHFLLFNLIYYFKGWNDEKKKNIIKNMVLGLAVFFVISGLWAGTISEKYDKLTFSTSGEYNHNLVGPAYTDNPTISIKQPIYYEGLLKPPNNSSTSIWDDLSYVKMKQWSSFDSWRYLGYQFKILGENLRYAAIIIESFFIIAGILVLAIIFFIWRSKSSAKDKLSYLLITMLIYIVGYSFIMVEWRYFFFIFILLIVATFYLIDTLYKNKFIRKSVRNILLVILMFCFIFQPVYETILFSNNDNELYSLSNTLKSDYDINGNIASSSNSPDEWWNAMILSYYLNSKYYGSTKETNNTKKLQKELESNNIDYYFVWNNESVPKLSNYKKITNNKINGLIIYSRIDRS